ncbi:type II toxin-antitoxin system Phd/YefM family antitoxin [Mesorhizobium sp. M7A.T.Ca.TU.009.02.1.1]|uniref:type II toxin-antitoxin system Phd/YefM family antitoxin n=1 Tax=Mesorhizobium sp. M7A.T.Ca.TU.009.02.1.1 TaxID=2496791 RepID=UPI000FCB3FF8|nr:type II toxin-antitoxin system Phd/YefM family antitoxin [Mesorhizobium sp. M7A.T.Ca.TU.009.02.1.1]RUT87425.1 type II toxin-antitoxin system Phd/YefM family antitoxin [Mesorhizobium sp. M7A.T.Ca.US.000.02.1.1]RUT93002.1 type II toxin-antitoxin system Phd/YefM family antitoxin [Mesorhizobium sp. M7A.T.Ca.US.000.02.2.1]RUU66755.1 type II toxin-antitoxin system Phd/YefM family antitoxin [Mesorhizobium sp. M7A.T.Ca.TU.009.01.1.1]RUU76532.1 type II toxin-antitoxin system Phd/YefM family antitoxin
MKTVQLQQAKATLSAIVEAAGNGEPTIITENGRPAAMIGPVDEGRKLYPQDSRRNLADWLLRCPGDIEFERNESPSRDVEF